MRIHLEQLPHQQAALEAITKAFDSQPALDQGDDVFPDFEDMYANPRLKPMVGIDVKMETGTGKTYVYTRLMHELYRLKGINKFVIMTPSLAIKEGTRSFIQSEYANQHFRELYPGQKLALYPVNAGDFSTKRGKRKQLAPGLSEYAEASVNDVGTISALLINDAMLGSKSMTRDDYDQTLVGGVTSPIEAIALTRPIVIIDEPHRFPKTGKAWERILQLKPQLIIRFGATFPQITIGRGKNRQTRTDYDNLVYDLNAVESFNQGLVKGVEVSYPGLSEADCNNRYQVKSATNTTLTLRQGAVEHEIRVGEQLSGIDPAFEGGLTYEGKQLSNDLEVAEGMWLVPGVWTNSYQEVMLSQAIDAHFQAERELFHRPNNAPRVKVLSLFFIDSIPSYRAEDGWLKTTFERLLAAKLVNLLQTEVGEYRAFLEATHRSLEADNQQVHAGYFAEDSTNSELAIQQQVDDILRNKEKLLQFKDERGEWNTRRFLFSKWTLREGWDNPNVFVLTKLRTSGSESSKIQEVGRGLRLPVDEKGNRLSNEPFTLSFLIDYSERDFAQRLITEVNNDGGGITCGKISDAIIGQLVKIGYGNDANAVFVSLLQNGIIDYQRNVLDHEALSALIPLGVDRDKIREKSAHKSTVHLRTDKWEQIRTLWEQASKRYMVEYQRLSEEELESLANEAISRVAFSDNFSYVYKQKTWVNQESGRLELREENAPVISNHRSMKYGLFLRELNRSTNLPFNLLHKAVIKALEGEQHPDGFFNERSLQKLVSSFRSVFRERFAQQYEYIPLRFRAHLNIFDEHGEFKKELAQGLVGTQLATDVTVPGNYLYDEAAFDSALEHQVLKLQPHENIVVFGKLPRRSIRIPTYMGGTTTPDFVYAVMALDGSVSRLYALVETKDKDVSDLYADERVAIEAQERFGQLLPHTQITQVTDAREIQEILSSLSRLDV